MDDVYVDTFSDTVFFMAPQHLISYVYGSSVRLVTFEVKSVGTGNALQLRVVDPPNLVESNKNGPTMEKQVKDAFKKIIQP